MSVATCFSTAIFMLFIVSFFLTGMLDIIRQFHRKYCWSLCLSSSLDSGSLIYFDTSKPDSRYLTLFSRVSTLISSVVTLFCNVCISTHNFFISSSWPFSLIYGFFFLQELELYFWFFFWSFFFLRSRLCAFLLDVKMMSRMHYSLHRNFFDSYRLAFFLSCHFEKTGAEWKNPQY